ncbi:MAG: hypothetical protein U5K79_16485 [Cyclobacteriaceae bacterium]|nr:hypothetical protein [Cyclobacteriaceae bacterium]
MRPGKEKEDCIVQDLYGEQLEEWFQYMGKELGIPFDKNQVKDHRYINSVFFSHGFIGITTNESPDPGNVKLIERFAKVFQQTYTRFLDLPKSRSAGKEDR